MDIEKKIKLSAERAVINTYAMSWVAADGNVVLNLKANKTYSSVTGTNFQVITPMRMVITHGPNGK